MLYIILPAYNEVQGLGLIFADIQRHCTGLAYRIIVINDGSTDGTGELLRQACAARADLVMLEHPVNRGLGQALLTGFRYAVRQDAAMDQQADTAEMDMIITLDADNTHPADRIPLLYQAICAGADVAIASRFVSGAQQYGLNSLRRMLSWGAGLLMRACFPREGLRDYSCGFRAYRLGVMREALQTYDDQLIECRSFAAAAEILLKLLPFCHRVQEIPLELHYERKLSCSKLRIGATVSEYFKLIYRLKRATESSLEWAEP
ncbi:MAG: glycosyltransferase family 2 protein [Peptococcaceae bacterium]|jgi:dolichol-phosphate mannosyltransferase|nr:glycosyltransferase family 2 protein [Peptococcaceae bacterium]